MFTPSRRSPHVPSRAAAATAAAARTVLGTMAVVLMLMSTVLVAMSPPTAAEDLRGGNSSPSPSAAAPAGAARSAVEDVPVVMGRPGVEPVVSGWAETGLAVPLLLVMTAGMLLGGAALLWRRCRDTTAAGDLSGTGAEHPSISAGPEAPGDLVADLET